MCLFSEKYLFKQIAQKDIPVYKILYDFEGVLSGPYRIWHYKIGEETTSKLEQMYKFDDAYYRSVAGLYSYLDKKSAKSFYADKPLFRRLKNCKIYKCIIPKGSYYITDNKVIISDRLIPKRKCIFQ